MAAARLWVEWETIRRERDPRSALSYKRFTQNYKLDEITPRVNYEQKGSFLYFLSGPACAQGLWHFSKLANKFHCQESPQRGNFFYITKSDLFAIINLKKKRFATVNSDYSLHNLTLNRFKKMKDCFFIYVIYFEEIMISILALISVDVTSLHIYVD